MTFIVPFQGEFCGRVRTIYAVNEDNPESVSGHTTTSERCPHCRERHFYRVYEHYKEYEKDGYFVEVYDCKCASCSRSFDLKIEHEIE